MELENQKEDQESQISGAYIRSLVKELRTTKDPINSNQPNSSNEGISQKPPNLTGNRKSQPPAPPQHKKQVRRRLHTSRPYQERLMNMAEARREIVTALKFHRASMKKAAATTGDQNQSPAIEDPPPARYQEGKIRPRKNPKANPCSKSDLFPTHNNNYYYQSSNSLSWSQFPIPHDIALPEQTLGLNLNFHDFNNLETSIYQNGNVSYNSNSNSNSSSSSSPSLSIATDPNSGNSTASNSGGGGGRGGGLHVAVGDEEMAEIRSIGEKHEMEWSDKMNLVKSAWWFRFLKKEEDHGFGFGNFNQFDDQAALEFPDWLNDGNEDGRFYNDYYCSDDYSFHDPALPCMDIGEFEGMDGEWLA